MKSKNGWIRSSKRKIILTFFCLMGIHFLARNLQAQSKMARQELQNLSQFLSKYQTALQNEDRTFLEVSTQFPFLIESITYEGETKKVSTSLQKEQFFQKLPDWKEKLLFDEGLTIALENMRPEQMKTGQEKCGDLKHPDRPDFRKGTPAFSIKGEEATFTYLADACAAETHRQTWHLKKVSGLFRLVKVTVEPKNKQ